MDGWWRVAPPIGIILIIMMAMANEGTREHGRSLFPMQQPRMMLPPQHRRARTCLLPLSIITVTLPFRSLDEIPGDGGLARHREGRHRNCRPRSQRL